jgi:hypothetical protein
LIGYAEFERGVVEARARLDGTRFEEAWSEGQKLSLEQAMAGGGAIAEQIKHQAASIPNPNRQC